MLQAYTSIPSDGVSVYFAWCFCYFAPSLCYDSRVMWNPFTSTIFHEIEVWTYVRWNHKVDSQNKSRSRIYLEISVSKLCNILFITRINKTTQIMKKKTFNSLITSLIICIHNISTSNIDAHIHIITTEASELSRSRVGTRRLPNGLGQGSTPLVTGTNCFGTWWFPPGWKMVFCFFLVLLEGFFLDSLLL